MGPDQYTSQEAKHTYQSHFLKAIFIISWLLTRFNKLMTKQKVLHSNGRARSGARRVQQCRHPRVRGEKRQGKHATINRSGTHSGQASGPKHPTVRSSQVEPRSCAWYQRSQDGRSTKRVLYIALSVKLQPGSANRNKASSVIYTNNCNF